MGYEKGEVVLKDVPFAYVIKVDRRSGICDFCVKPSKKALKNCSACKLVYYCDAVCQKKGWRAHHRSECQCLRQVSPKIIEGLNGHVLHMARIILKLQKGIVVL